MKRRISRSGASSAVKPGRKKIRAKTIVKIIAGVVIAFMLFLVIGNIVSCAQKKPLFKVNVPWDTSGFNSPFGFIELNGTQSGKHEQDGDGGKPGGNSGVGDGDQSGDNNYKEDYEKALDEIADITQKVVETEQKLKDIQDQYEEAKGEATSLKGQIAQLTEEYDKKVTESNRLRAEISEAQNNLELSEKQKQELLEKFLENEESKEMLLSSIEELTQKINDGKITIEEYKQKQAEAEDNINALNLQIDDLLVGIGKANKENEGLRIQLSDLTDDVERLNELYEAQREAAEKLELEKTQISGDCEALRAERAQLLEDLENAGGTNAEISERLEEINLLLEQKENDLITKQTALDQANAILTTKQTELEQAQAALIAKQTELDQANAILTAKQNELEQAQAALNVKQQDVEEANQTISSLSAQLLAANNAKNDLEAQIAILNQQLEENTPDELQQQLATANAELEAQKNIVSSLNAANSSLNSEINWLRNQLASRPNVDYDPDALVDYIDPDGSGYGRFYTDYINGLLYGSGSEVVFIPYNFAGSELSVVTTGTGFNSVKTLFIETKSSTYHFKKDAFENLTQLENVVIIFGKENGNNYQITIEDGAIDSLDNPELNIIVGSIYNMTQGMTNVQIVCNNSGVNCDQINHLTNYVDTNDSYIQQILSRLHIALEDGEKLFFNEHFDWGV